MQKFYFTQSACNELESKPAAHDYQSGEVPLTPRDRIAASMLKDMQQSGNLLL